MRKILTFLFAALMSVGMWADPIVVGWSWWDITAGTSFSQGGVTLTCSGITAEGGDYPSFSGPGTFTSSIGNFTKIQFIANEENLSGEGWHNGSDWTGDAAASVSFSGNLNGISSIKFTIEGGSAPEPEPEPAVPSWVRDGDEWDDATKTLTVKSNLSESAYESQTVIEHVIINNSVTSIGDYAFQNCSGLKSVSIGNSVSSIGRQAFAYCYGLTSMTIDATTPPSFGKNPFRNLTVSAIKLYVPASLASAYKAASTWQGFDIYATIAAHEDPQNAGVYYSTFYHGGVDVILPADVEAYKATISGDALNLTSVAVSGQSIPAGNAVILRSSIQEYDLAISTATEGEYDGNVLQGVDAETLVANAQITGTCYVLSGTQSEGVGFYEYSGESLHANKAYVDRPNGANPAPRRMRFVYDQATGVENVQGDKVQSTKVLRDGQLIIIRNGVEYNANGMMVK